MFYAAAKDVVGFSKGTVRVHPDLWYNKKTDTPGPVGGPLNAGQKEMYYVFGEVVFSRGDKPLGSLNLIDTLIPCSRIGHCPGPDPAHVRSCVRLGQAHGPAPHARVHLLHEKCPVFIRAEVFNQPSISHGQAGIAHHGQVGAHENLAYNAAHDRGQALSTKLRGVGDSHPAVFRQYLPALMK